LGSFSPLLVSLCPVFHFFYISHSAGSSWHPMVRCSPFPAPPSGEGGVLFYLFQVFLESCSPVPCFFSGPCNFDRVGLRETQSQVFLLCGFSIHPPIPADSLNIRSRGRTFCDSRLFLSFLNYFELFSFFFRTVKSACAKNRSKGFLRLVQPFFFHRDRLWRLGPNTSFCRSVTNYDLDVLFIPFFRQWCVFFLIPRAVFAPKCS